MSKNSNIFVVEPDNIYCSSKQDFSDFYLSLDYGYLMHAHINDSVITATIKSDDLTSRNALNAIAKFLDDYSNRAIVHYDIMALTPEQEKLLFW